jgi:hypothetical protein
MSTDLNPLIERLIRVAELLRQGKESPSVTVREFLAWAGAQRRGFSIVRWIRLNLMEAGLDTDPDFESAYVDSSIKFVLSPPPTLTGRAEVQSTISPVTATISVSTAAAGQNEPSYADPTHRISKLAAANNVPVCVAPTATMQQAVTIMLTNDFSQLPVMTSEREVKGVVSWESVGTRLALGKNGQVVSDFMESHQEIRHDSSLFQAIPIIAQHTYVLVRGSDNRITGIITASDLNLQFQQLAEPFLLLDEIENHIRRMLSDRFSTTELASVRDPNDGGRVINDVEDLTFGEYVRLLEDPERWKKLGLEIDRVTFCKTLNRVREIRNDVMHFDPDGIPPSDLDRLREFAGFLQKLQAIGVA